MKTWRCHFSILLVMLGLCSALAAAAPVQKTRVEIKDGWYYINGHKFFVNAIGYEPGARPGEAPYIQRVSHLPEIKQDLQNIKAAGFNGIRTWDEMTEDELKLVQESGLKIIFGIGLKPDVDLGDPKTLEKDLEQVRRTLAYSKKYDCVITYLIMNEPQPSALHKAGGQAIATLWTQVRDLIHKEHPGIPVTMSGNSAITGWQDLNMFDVYGHNMYDYQTEGSNFTHRYANTNRYVSEINGGLKPALITEFGRSVSRQGAGAGQYGGNTLEVQAEALVHDYRDLLDSGAAGVCPFYYADGWWKGGEPSVHNDASEEWFGFWGFKDINDKVGYPRPVWHALRQYNEALFTSPKNQQFYQNEVPIEGFFQPDVKKIKVVYLDGVVLEAAPDANGYYAGKLSFAGEDLKDRELVFESYDAQGKLLKTETIIVLTGKDPIQWPTLELRTSVTDLTGVEEVPIEVSLKNNAVFSLGTEVRYVFAPHKGWEPGETHQWKSDPSQKEQTFKDSYKLPAESFVLGLYTGTDIRYGKFTKTLYAQKYLFRGNWADPIRAK